MPRGLSGIRSDLEGTGVPNPVSNQEGEPAHAPQTQPIEEMEVGGSQVSIVQAAATLDSPDQMPPLPHQPPIFTSCLCRGLLGPQFS